MPWNSIFENCMVRAETIDIIFFVVSKAKNVESFVHDLHFFNIIDRVDSNLAETHQWIVIDVIGKFAAVMEVHLVGDHEVEDVVASLTWRLISDARFLQEVSLNISTSHPTHVVEPNSDELSEPG